MVQKAGADPEESHMSAVCVEVGVPACKSVMQRDKRGMAHVLGVCQAQHHISKLDLRP